VLDQVGEAALARRLEQRASEEALVDDHAGHGPVRAEQHRQPVGQHQPLVAWGEILLGRLAQRRLVEGTTGQDTPRLHQRNSRHPPKTHAKPL